MASINTQNIADIELVLTYASPLGLHEDRMLARGVNFWRDLIPHPLHDSLIGKKAGDTVTADVPAGVLVPAKQAAKEFSLPLKQFQPPSRNGDRQIPRYGRFYPKGLLKGVSGIFPQNQQPFRCIGVDDKTLGISFNHPLADSPLSLAAHVHQVQPKAVERGGTSVDWGEVIAESGGMQTRYNGQPTDFLPRGGLQREDSSEDRLFYRQPRFVNHMDDMALTIVTQLYGRLLQPGIDVLDLMSSWVSHLPDSMRFNSVTGLGLNRVELSANDRLDRFEVHDLNQTTRLPFGDESFDAIVCTASIEYLTNPIDVLYDAARVLKPQGVVVLAFTNRWFPPKVTHIWPSLHEFERLGLVLDYLDKTRQFSDFNTLSVRGYPRPITDKYYPALLQSDPVYAVWATRG